MTELTFLIDLLLNHELKKETRDAVAVRIKDVEALISAKPMVMPAGRPIAQMQGQAPSTLAAMERHGMEVPPPVPVEAIAQTPAAATAMNYRATLLAKAQNPNMKEPKVRMHQEITK